VSSVAAASAVISEATELSSGEPGRPNVERSKLFLHPGRLFAAAEAHQVITILGSCVSVCLWDHRRGWGGINHFALPFRVARTESSLRFGDVAMRRLIETLLALGSRSEDLWAWVFGGACVVQAFRGDHRHLGRKNVEVALAILEARKIFVRGTDVGGEFGRKVIFHTDDGGVAVKLLTGDPHEDRSCGTAG
jgi:chemotaxis protein CheD